MARTFLRQSWRPFVAVTAHLEATARQAGQWWRSQDVQVDTIVKLSEENDRLRAAAATISGLLEQQSRWQEALDFVPLPDYRRFVLQGGGAQWWLEQGCEVGLRDDQVVLDVQSRVLGRLSKVQAGAAQVLSFANPGWSLLVRVGDLDLPLQMSTENGQILVINIPNNVDIEEDNDVVTAGESGVSGGLAVGKIGQIVADPVRGVKQAEVITWTQPQVGDVVQLRPRGEFKCE